MKPDKPPPRASMSLATSPAHDVAKLMGRRNVSIIPKDQKSLLERKDSWAVDQDGTKGLATVPKQVLQTLKEAFIRLQGEADEENPAEEEEEDEDEEEEENPDLPRPSSTNYRGRQNGHLPGSTAARPSSPPPSSPEVPISSWSESPPRSRGREQDAMSDVDAPDETPGSPMHMTVPEVLSQPLFHATPNPSALSEPEDLEMELPQAHEAREAPINRVPTVMRPVAATQEPASLVTSLPSTTDTPPCAQPQAATSSGTPKSSLVKASAAHGRSRRMKPIAFSDDNSPKAAAPAANPSPFTRRPSMRSLPGPNVDNSLYSSSDTPAPFERERVHRFPSPPPPPPPPHNFTRSATSQHRTHGQLDGAVSRDISPSRQTPMHQLYRIQAAVNVSISDSVAPYRAFTATYPDYTTVHSGNLLSFIQACVYLRMLQEERRMREYLYDDFIRAWSSGFLPYVQNAGPGQEPLPAVEWFNMLKGPILFNRMCVNAGNIDVVLGAYPEEASRIKAILDRSLQTEQSPEPEPEMLPGVEMELELDTEPEPDRRPEPEPEPELRRKQRREPEVIDILTSEGAMDITADEEPQVERHPLPPPPPPTREAPSLPAPSRTAPPPPPPPPPRPASPELGSDDYFDTPPLPPKPPSSARPRPRSRSRSGSRSRSHQPSRAPAQPRPIPQTQQPQPQLQPQRQLTLPQRQSPKRRQTASIPPIPTSFTAPPPSSTTATPSKRPRPKSPTRSTTEQQQQQHRGGGHIAPSSSRPIPSSSTTTTTANRPIPKPRKRTAEERARLKEHFRKKATSSSTSHIGSGLD
ncbi:hypothetical protein TgHK011_009663 [Trichoderma gracile]|nr:hypothetical protein TgHK011_009663 [Trichoderma gracile]